MSDQYLLLWLEAPLQSWGHDSKFGRRDTLDFPTKSGVFGLLCCALGKGGEQKELLKRLSKCQQTVISFVRTKKNGERCDREPLLRDFHMIGAGYNLDDNWEKFLEPYMSNGKPRKSEGRGSKMTYRYYLQNSYFAVILQIPEKVLADDLTNALRNPVWDLYLGRKNCVPTDFIYQGLFTTAEKAESKSFDIAQGKKLTEDFRVLDGPYQEEGEVFPINDVPIQFGQNKQYRDRFVTMIKKHESDE